MDASIMHTIAVQRRLDGARRPRARGRGDEQPQAPLPARRGLGSSFDIDQVLEVVMDLVFEHVKADRGIILLVDERTGELVPKVVRTRDDEEGQGDGNAAGDDRPAAVKAPDDAATPIPAASPNGDANGRSPATRSTPRARSSTT